MSVDLYLSILTRKQKNVDKTTGNGKLPLHSMGMTLNYNQQSYLCSLILVGEAQFSTLEVLAEMPMTR